MPERSVPPSRSRIRALLAAAILASGASYAPALLNDNTVNGAATSHIFSSAFGDSVDALSGQLYFQVESRGLRHVPEVAVNLIEWLSRSHLGGE